MNYLNNRLINKEAVKSLFEQDYQEEWQRGYHNNGIYITNRLSLKIRGVKEAVRAKLYFKEPIEGSLALHNWVLEYAAVKIGEGRQAAIEDKIIETFDQEEYLVPYWTENRFQSCCHFKKDYFRKECTSFLLEKDVEPELLMDVFADLSCASRSLEKTRLVLHNGKVYSRLLEHPDQLLTDEEINEYAAKHSNSDKDIILDQHGNTYTFYAKPKDLNNIRLITKEAYRSNPISDYASYTYREFAAQQNLSIDENFPIVCRTESESEKGTYINGTFARVPFTQVIEMKIYSPRILGEKLPEYQLGDYVRYNSNETGFIIDISEKDKGLYGIQNERTWVYYGGEKAKVENIHTSLLEVAERPTQEDIGQIVFCYDGEQGSYGNELYGYLGEVIYEFTKHYIVKVPSFKKPLNIEAINRLKKDRTRHDYHANYVDNGDGFIYATVHKDNCYFLKPEYVGWYEQFRNQIEQFEWVRNHNILGKFLYPLLETMDNTVIRPSLYDLSYQFDAFCAYLDYYTSNKSPEDYYLLFIEHLKEKRYEYLRSVTLRGMYDVTKILEQYFSETKVEKLPELEELLG